MMTSSEISLLDPELVADPFTVYGRLASKGGLVRGVIPGMEPMWLATAYGDVRQVLTDPRFVMNASQVPDAEVVDLAAEMWRANGIPKKYAVYLRAGISQADGHDHRRLRRLVSGAFTPRRVERLRPRIGELADILLEALPGKAVDGQVDLLRHFAYPLPIAVISELVGVPAVDQQRFWRWSAVFAAGTGPGMGEAIGEMVDYLHGLVETRRRAGADDLITALVAAQDADGDRLSDVEMVTMILHLVIAGYETTANLIANGTAALLGHPEQLDMLRRDPALMPRAVRELMRYCGPGLGTFSRYATEDLYIGETLVRKGQGVMPVLAGANRDTRVFVAADRLDITREPGDQHLGFGAGPHFCLGAGLAGAEAEIAFTALWRHYPDLELADALEHGPNPGTWHLAALPVRLGETPANADEGPR